MERYVYHSLRHMSTPAQDPIALQNEREALKQECIRLRQKMTEIAEYGETIELDYIRATYDACMNKLRESLGLRPNTTLDSIIRTDTKDDLVRSCALMNDELKRLRAENARLREANTRHVMSCNERDEMITESSAQHARVLEAIERGLGGHTFCVDGIPPSLLHQIEELNYTRAQFKTSKEEHANMVLSLQAMLASRPYDHSIIPAAIKNAIAGWKEQVEKYNATQSNIMSMLAGEKYDKGVIPTQVHTQIHALKQRVIGERECNQRQVEMLNERDHMIQQLRRKCDTFADERDKIRNELEQRIKAAEHANQRADLITTRMHQYAKIAGDLTTQVKEFEHIKQELAVLHGQIDACTRERDGLIKDLAYWRGQYKDAFAQVEDACQRACELEHAVANLTAQRNTLQANMQRQRDEIDACVGALYMHMRTVQ
jgi:DNA repair exonuclease SbcCD ATPase subunit